jgi:small subunit ribosomal protein S8
MAKTSQRVRQARPAKFKTREYSRCRRCGRSRAVYRKFGLCRICLRELAHDGYVRNGITAAHETVDIPSSKLKRELARILKEQGYIRDFAIQAPTPDRPAELIRVTLKYTDDRTSAISGLKRVSRPGQRTYVGHGEIPKVLGGMGTAIVSTSRGVMTGHEARQAGVGGEVVAHVW